MGFFDNLFGFDDMIKNQRNDIIDLLNNDNPIVTVNHEKVNLTTKDGHDKFVNALSEMKKLTILDALLGGKLDESIDVLISKADKLYNEANTKSVDDDTRPSNSLPENVRTNIENLVDEYLNDVIYQKYNPEASKKTQIRNSFLEFASWIYNK